MSEARPITNITDFVCGNCWNSFSRNDPGVDQGDKVLCPHCGNVLPVAGAGAWLTELVRQAPSTRSDSDNYDAPVAPTAAQGGGFPELVRDSGYGWLPPEMAELMPIKPGSSGYVVGEADDFGFAETTLPGQPTQGSIVDQVRAAPSRPEAAVRARGQSDDFDVAVDEPTPVDSDPHIQQALQQAIRESQSIRGTDLSDLSAALEEIPPTDSAPELPTFAGPEAPVVPAAAALEDLSEGIAASKAQNEELEHRDWKLKAMGLTYNFHGLDALIGWASNKSGQTLSVSMDGVAWKDFGSFFESVKGGLPLQVAFDTAHDPGTAPAAQQTPIQTGRSGRATTTMTKAAVGAPELQMTRPVVGPEDTQPASGSGAASSAVANPNGRVSGGSSANIAAADKAQGAASLGVTGKRSKIEAAAVADKKISPMIIAVAVVVGLAVIVGVLHVMGVKPF